MTLLEQRISKIRYSLDEWGLDAILIRSTSNIWWTCGYSNVFDSEQAHALIVSHRGVWLHTDGRYSTALRQSQAQAGDESLEIDDRRMSHIAYAIEVLKEEYGSVERFCLAVEDSISFREFHACEKQIKALPHLSLIDVSNFIERLREIKDDTELSLLQTAQSITDEAFSYIVGVMKPGMSEKEIQRKLDYKMLELGADGLSFDSIVATGARAALPHALPSDALLEKGHCVVMDFGARYQGYCADMTRTVFVGNPSEKLKRAWNAVRKANETCKAAIRCGIRGCDLQELAQRILDEEGFQGGLNHSLGHGVGLDIHEGPSLSSTNENPLVPGHVVTVEPGLYYAGEFGMRLEDFGVVREKDFDVFTKSTHEMVII